MTAAHFQTVSISVRLREWVPEHAPRSSDPAYKLFGKAKRLLKQHDIPCWRCGVHYGELVKRGEPATDANPLAAYQLEAHHADLEFSLLNGVDVERWWMASHPSGVNDVSALGLVQAFSNVDGWLARHPEYQARVAGAKPDAWHAKVFTAYMESEGNLQQLCDVCHRSKDQGVHRIPYPDWRAGRNVWRAGQPPHIT